MNYILAIISTIPFFAYIYLLIKEEIMVDKKDYKLFRFDTLILIAIFIYFAKFKVVFVNKLLFFTICLYLFVNKLYEKKLKEKLDIKANKIEIIIGYVLAILTFLPYILWRKLLISYLLAFGFILVFHLIMIVVNKILKK
jgi:membrane protein